MTPARWRQHIGALWAALAAWEPWETTFTRWDATLVYQQSVSGHNAITLRVAPPTGTGPHTAAANAALLRALLVENGPVDRWVDEHSGTFAFHAPAHGPATWELTGEAT